MLMFKDSGQDWQLWGMCNKGASGEVLGSIHSLLVNIRTLKPEDGSKISTKFSIIKQSSNPEPGRNNHSKIITAGSKYMQSRKTYQQGLELTHWIQRQDCFYI